MKISIINLPIEKALIIHVSRKGNTMFTATFDWKDGYAVLRKMEVPRSWRGVVTRQEVKRIIKAVNDTATILGTALPGSYPSLAEYDFRDTIIETTRLGKLAGVR